MANQSPHHPAVRSQRLSRLSLDSIRLDLATTPPRRAETTRMTMAILLLLLWRLLLLLLLLAIQFLLLLLLLQWVLLLSQLSLIPFGLQCVGRYGHHCHLCFVSQSSFRTIPWLRLDLGQSKRPRQASQSVLGVTTTTTTRRLPWHWVP